MGYLDEKGLTHLLTAFHDFFNKKISSIMNITSKLQDKQKDDYKDLSAKINSNTELINKNKDDLNAKINQIDATPKNNIEGDLIEINNIETYYFDNVKENDVVELDCDSDCLIQCYETSYDEEIELETIECSKNNIDMFEYDENYVKLTDDGFQAINKLQIQLIKKEYANKDNMYLYISKDTIPKELIDNIDNIESIEVINNE